MPSALREVLARRRSVPEDETVVVDLLTSNAWKTCGTIGVTKPGRKEAAAKLAAKLQQRTDGRHLARRRTISVSYSVRGYTGYSFGGGYLVGERGAVPA